jgi:hypothetical protein
MTTAPITPELLSAYVDGELTVAEAAKVARAMADDRALAEQVAQLSRLKPMTLDPASPRPARRIGLAALAASIAAALLVAGTLLFGPWSAPSPPAALTQAWRLHEAWASNATTEASEKVALIEVRTALGAEAMPPDLSSARLTLARVVLLDEGHGAPLMHAGYSGTRGCHISYFVLADGAALPEAFSAFGEGKARAYAWRIGALGFLVLSEGMDPKRFALIAESLHAAAVKRAPLDQETRIALTHSRETSAPCSA